MVRDALPAAFVDEDVAMNRALDRAEVSVEYENLRPRRVHVYHVGCGGELISTGNGMSNTFGTTWANKCNKCGHESWASQGYPYVEYVKA